jgi:hypothetical protein
MEAKTVIGHYGSNRTTTDVFVYGDWYVCEGGQTVNRTNDPIEDGVYVEEVKDYDCFTVNDPIMSLDELIAAVDE